MHPIFGLWLGLLVVYLIITGRAQVTIEAWRGVIKNPHKQK